jgi:hypothetical protein
MKDKIVVMSPVVSYRLDGFTEAEGKFIERVLGDPRGWKRLGYRFRRYKVGPRSGELGFVATKTEPSELKRRFKDIPKLSNLSVTDMRASPRQIYFHAGNWKSPPSAYGGSRHKYRQYLVNHEVGHVLDRGHVKPGGAGAACPLMYQQSKGTRGVCTPYSWPTARSREGARS